MDINPTALEKLKSLNEEFIAAGSSAAKKNMGFFDSWFYTKADRQKELTEYSDYNMIAGGALNNLTLFDKKEDAVQALTGLKGAFNDKAAACDKASYRFFASWTGKESRQAVK